MSASDWEALDALMALYGEASMANTVRRAVKAERARKEREEAERLAAEQSRLELQQRLAARLAPEGT
jgi:hypothetical protein